MFEEFGDGFKVTLFRKTVNGASKVSNAVENISNALEKVSNDLKKVSNTNKKEGSAFDLYKNILEECGTTHIYVENINKVFNNSGIDEVFGQADVMNWLKCSKSKATNVMNAMKKANVIEKVTGLGAGKYKFIEAKDSKK